MHCIAYALTAKQLSRFTTFNGKQAFIKPKRSRRTTSSSVTDEDVVRRNRLRICLLENNHYSEVYKNETFNTYPDTFFNVRTLHKV